MAFHKSNHRNEQIGLYYLALIPLIGIFQYYLNYIPRFDLYLYLNSSFLLFCYYINLPITLFFLVNLLHCILLDIYVPESDSLLQTTFNNLFFGFLNFISPTYLKSFTFAEFAIVIQCFSIYLIKLMHFYLECWLLPETEYTDIEKIGHTAYSCFICFIIFAILIDRRLFRSEIFIPLLVALTYWNVFHFLNKEPIRVILEYIFQDEVKVKLFLDWIWVSVTTISFAVLYAYFCDTPATTVTRKIFHLAISIVFITGVKNDAHFLRFASQLAFFVFVVIETIRVSDTSIISNHISRVFECFRDEKDVGELTLTHMYLLLGCSLPVWVAPNQGKLLLLSGVISIGISDTCASFIGYYFGRYRLPNSNKSIEGMLAFMVSNTIAMVLLDYYLNEQYPSVRISACLFISAICSLFEALTKHIDNLLLPFVNYFLCLVLLD